MSPLGTVFRHGVSWAGLAVGPAMWALSTQGNYALAPHLCGRWLHANAGLSLGLALVSFAAALSSWRAWRRHQGPGLHIPEQDGHPRHLLSGIGVAAGILFGLVIVMQGVAAVIVDPCLR
jgi:hypothetical protein